VIRLNLRSQPAKLYTPDGREVVLAIGLGQNEVHHQLRYKGKVPVNVIGIWRTGMPEPLRVMSNLAPEEALRINEARTKIDESFKDLKNLLGLDKLINQSQEHMEQMAALTMIIYAIGLIIGETLRDALYPPPQATAEPPGAPSSTRRCTWEIYSGLFILLKQKLTLSAEHVPELVDQALRPFPNSFAQLSGLKPELMSRPQHSGLVGLRPDSALPRLTPQP
jgi:hypothetical protein